MVILSVWYHRVGVFFLVPLMVIGLCFYNEHATTITKKIQIVTQWISKQWNQCKWLGQLEGSCSQGHSQSPHCRSCGVSSNDRSCWTDGHLGGVRASLRCHPFPVMPPFLLSHLVLWKSPHVTIYVSVRGVFEDMLLKHFASMSVPSRNVIRLISKVFFEDFI